jgi:hypothetical protein
VNKIPFDRLERIIKATINDLEKRKDKAMVRTDADNLWPKIESFQWVLFVIFAIKNDRMVVIEDVPKYSQLLRIDNERSLLSLLFDNHTCDIKIKIGIRSLVF